MPQMNPDLLQMMAELADDSDIMGQISQSVPSRSRGAGTRVSIGGSGGSGYSVPQLAREYVGQEQASAEAADDGQNGPVAAKSHAMAYMEDPQWQHWDRMRSGAVNNMKGGGGFWGWATGGRYNNALGQEAQYADYMARQIEKRYLDEATVRAANTDRYDWTKPSRQAVYNPETGTYADEFTGTLGGKAMRPVDRPTQDMVTETGAVVSATRGPANQGWVTKGAALPSETKYINGSTEPSAEGPFAGGVAESEESMPVIRDAKMLSENAKARSEVKRDEAAAKKDEALAAAAGAEEFSSASPGSVVYDKRSGKQKFSVPQTASQSGDRPDKPAMTYEEAAKLVLGRIDATTLPANLVKEKFSAGMRLLGFDAATRKPLAAEPAVTAATGGFEVWVRDPNSPIGWRKESGASGAQQPVPQAKPQAPVAAGGGLADSAREVIRDAGAVVSAVAKGKAEEAKKIKEFAGDAWGAATNPMGFARRMRDKYLP